MTRPLLIVGASGRAAAASALRAGYSPFVVDLFADADTLQLAPTIRCPLEEYPHGLPALAEHAPPGPWMYTGGIENHPDVIEAISAKRELFGFGVGDVQRMRDPSRLGEFAHLLPNGRACAMRKGDDPPQVRGGWLRKPLRSSGGTGIREAEQDEPPSKDHYYQEYVDGIPASLLFAGNRLVGRSRQLIGTAYLHAHPFHYAGSLQSGGDSSRSDVLADSNFPSWGIDCVSHQCSHSIIEINPRYTAAMELIEIPHEEAIAKGIYFAPHDLLFPSEGPWEVSLDRCRDIWELHAFADIPRAGSDFAAGDPVITMFLEGETEAEVLESLQRRAAELDQLFSKRRSP